MFDRFTEDARKSMAQSRQEAMRLGHDFIGTEHILLGVLVDEQGDVATTLRGLGVDVASLREDVERRAPRGKSTERGQLPFTPKAKSVLERALEEAQGFGHDFIGAAHLLLGLVRVEDGIAGEALRERGVTIAKARASVRPSLDAKPRMSSRPALRQNFTVEIVGADGAVIARRQSMLPFAAFGRGDRLRVEPSAPALRIVDVEHVFDSDDGAVQTLRLFTAPVADDRPKP